MSEVEKLKKQVADLQKKLVSKGICKECGADMRRMSGAWICIRCGRVDEDKSPEEMG